MAPTNKDRRSTVGANLPDWPSDLRRPTQLQKSLHKHDLDHRRRIILALWRSYSPGDKRRASRLNECGSAARTYVDPDAGKVRPWLSRCKSRLCPFCGRNRAARVADQISDLIRTMAQPKHITLTYRSNDDLLTVQLDMLKQAFRRLRGTAAWKRIVKGGVYTVEVTRNPDTDRWHPHLHIVVDADYFPVKQLAYLWSTFMPGGRNVWIKPVADAHGMAWEMAKYVGKPPNTRDWPAPSIVQYAHGVIGHRLLQTFGAYYNKELTDKLEKPAQAPREYFVNIPRLAWLAGQRFEPARRLASLIKRRWPIFAEYIDEVAPGLPDRSLLEQQLWHRQRLKAAGVVGTTPTLTAQNVLEQLDTKLFAAFCAFRDLDIHGQVPDRPEGIQEEYDKIHGNLHGQLA